MAAINFSDAVNAYQNAGRIATGPAAQAGTDGGFGDMLREAAGNVVDTIAKGEKASLQAASGQTSDLTAVTAAVNNAEVAVQTVVAIRDRVIAAYQDIMRMPI